MPRGVAMGRACAPGPEVDPQGLPQKRSGVRGIARNFDLHPSPVRVEASPFSADAAEGWREPSEARFQAAEETIAPPLRQTCTLAGKIGGWLRQSCTLAGTKGRRSCRIRCLAERNRRVAAPDLHTPRGKSAPPRPESKGPKRSSNPPRRFEVPPSGAGPPSERCGPLPSGAGPPPSDADPLPSVVGLPPRVARPLPSAADPSRAVCGPPPRVGDRSRELRTSSEWFGPVPVGAGPPPSDSGPPPSGTASRRVMRDPSESCGPPPSGSAPLRSVPARRAIRTGVPREPGSRAARAAARPRRRRRLSRRPSRREASGSPGGCARSRYAAFGGRA